MTNDTIVLQVIFNHSHHHFLHNFTRHWSETDKSIVAPVIFVALPDNETTFASFPSTGMTLDLLDAIEMRAQSILRCHHCKDIDVPELCSALNSRV